MGKDGTRFDAAFEIMEAARTHDDFLKALHNLRDIYQVANLGYHALHMNGIGDADLPMFTTCDPAWVKHYADRDFIAIDPVARAARQSNLPVDWAAVDRTSMDARYYFSELSRFEIGRHGMGIPIHGSDGSIAMFTFTSQIDDEAAWQSFRRSRKAELAFLGQVLHHRVIMITNGNDGPVHLTRQTKSCLQFFADGDSPTVIAHKMGLSITTIRRHLDRAQQRLGGKSKAEAVAKALRLGLINKKVAIGALVAAGSQYFNAPAFRMIFPLWV